MEEKQIDTFAVAVTAFCDWSPTSKIWCVFSKLPLSFPGWQKLGGGPADTGVDRGPQTLASTSILGLPWWAGCGALPSSMTPRARAFRWNSRDLQAILWVGVVLDMALSVPTWHQDTQAKKVSWGRKYTQGATGGFHWRSVNNTALWDLFPWMSPDPGKQELDSLGVFIIMTWFLCHNCLPLPPSSSG